MSGLLQKNVLQSELSTEFEKRAGGYEDHIITEKWK
jgi:hypothetical protein